MQDILINVLMTLGTSLVAVVTAMIISARTNLRAKKIQTETFDQEGKFKPGALQVSGCIENEHRSASSSGGLVIARAGSSIDGKLDSANAVTPNPGTTPPTEVNEKSAPIKICPPEAGISSKIVPEERLQPFAAFRNRPQPGLEGIFGFKTPSNSLLKRYYSLGLAQAQTHFVTSLIFSVLGFVLICLCVAPLILGERTIDAAISSGVGILAGAITEAVAALFFSQANKARDTMLAMHDRLRDDVLNSNENENRTDYLNAAWQMTYEIHSADSQDRMRETIIHNLIDAKERPVQPGASETHSKS